MTIPDPKVGGWALRDLLLHTEVNAIRTGLLRAIDGQDGGTYTLTSPLIIDGDVFEIDQELVIDAAALLSVYGDAGFAGDVSLQAGVVVEASATLTVDCAATFSTDVTIDDDLLLQAGGSTQIPSGHNVHIDEIEAFEINDEGVTLLLPILWGAPQWDTGAAVPTWKNAGGSWQALTNDSNTIVYIPLPIMAGDDITAVEVTIIGGAHGGVDPATKPTIQIVEATAAGVFSSAVAALSDSATLGAYDASHVVRLDATSTAGALPYTALSRSYAIAIIGERGANSAAINKITKVSVECIRRQLVSTNVFGA